MALWKARNSASLVQMPDSIAVPDLYSRCDSMSYSSFLVSHHFSHVGLTGSLTRSRGPPPKVKNNVLDRPSRTSGLLPKRSSVCCQRHVSPDVDRQCACAVFAHLASSALWLDEPPSGRQSGQAHPTATAYILSPSARDWTRLSSALLRPRLRFPGREDRRDSLSALRGDEHGENERRLGGPSLGCGLLPATPA